MDEACDCQPLSVIAGLTKHLCIPAALDPSALSALRYVGMSESNQAAQSIVVGQAERANAFNTGTCLLRSCLSTLYVGMGMSKPQQDAGRELDDDVAALVQALPQIRVLGLEMYAGNATDAGLQCKAMQCLHECSAWCTLLTWRYGAETQCKALQVAHEDCNSQSDAERVHPSMQDLACCQNSNSCKP